ncbi:pilus assembly PilX N-terminal domain-containing protein [Clostridium sp.]|jgi:hypothetical protein|uniref:pilus assembly PilX N-terminal domain-containing protein n=1 Tax=Clostridium sp. TaxID=1506 RepID=UPI003A5BF77C
MKKKGVALLIVIIVMMVVFSMAVFMIDTSIKNRSLSSNALDKTHAYYSAESGIYELINEYKKNYSKLKVDEDGNIDSIEKLSVDDADSSMYENEMEVHKTYVNSITRDIHKEDYILFTLVINSTGNYASQSSYIVSKVEIKYTYDLSKNEYDYSDYKIIYKGEYE